MATQEYRYFSAVPGHAVQRFGARSFICAFRTKDGFEWPEGEVARIPAAEVEQHLASYREALRNGSLVERDAAAFAVYHRASEQALDETVNEAKAALREPGGKDGD